MHIHAQSNLVCCLASLDTNLLSAKIVPKFVLECLPPDQQTTKQQSEQKKETQKINKKQSKINKKSTKNQQKLFQNWSWRVSWGDLGAILAPRATKNPKRLPKGTNSPLLWASFWGGPGAKVHHNPSKN